MLELIEFDVDDAVAWRIRGKVTESDMQLALDACRERIATRGEVSIYQEIEGFSGVEFDALMEKLHFIREFGISHFKRIAVVTDRQWLQKVIAWEDKLFSGIDMRAFSTEERDRAFNFLAYGDDPGSAPAAA